MDPLGSALVPDAVSNESEHTASEEKERNFFTELPFDVIARILIQYVGPKETAKLRTVSGSLYELCATDEFWKEFCCRELRMRPKDLSQPYKYRIWEDESANPGIIPSFRYDTAELQRGSPISFYEAYTRLIHPFRGLLNWFLLSKGAAWDDILTITFENGLVHGELWYLPADIGANMIPMSDFTVFIEEDTNEVMIRNDFIFTILTHSCHEVPLQKLITVGKRLADGRPSHAKFSFRAHRHHARRVKTIQEFIVAQKISWPESRPGQRRFEGQWAYEKLEALFDNTDTRAMAKQHDRRMFYPHRNLPAPVLRADAAQNLPHGLFKGAFGHAGSQLITVVWGAMPGAGQDSEFVTGFKTTGHPNRPAGTCLFLFRLQNSVFVRSEEGQRDVQSLENMAHAGSGSASRFDTTQPFVLPNAVRLPAHMDPELIPNECCARFFGRGAMASQQDETPTDVTAHLVVFSPNRFLVMWLGDVKVAVLFEKVAENDPFYRFV